MVANAPETPVQAEIVFVIEATAVNGAFINELKVNYLIPTLEYFHGGALEEGSGTGSVYAIVTYKAADCHPGVPVSVYGPFNNPQNVVEAVDKIQFIGGHAESRACITEALTTALTCFDEFGRIDAPMYAVLMCCSPPYSAYAGGIVPPGVPATIEQAARMLSERGVQLSITSARRIAALNSLYENAGGERLQAQQRNYAKDPKHQVLLRGYSLKERPPSPAPPPVPDIQTDVYGQGRGATAVPRGGTTPPFPRSGQGIPRLGWMPARPHALYCNNSALLTQLAQPSYPPPPPAHATQRMPGMMAATPSTSNTQQPQLQRSYIWSGVIELMEKGKAPGDQQKTTKLLPCQVSTTSKDIEPELKADTWPSKLLMQLMPKQLISNIGGQYLKDSKSVLFHLQPSEALDHLTNVMVNGYAGCVHFNPISSPPQCDIKVLMLLYTPDKKAYLGFIPNNQVAFVDRLRSVIQQQKITQQIINKQHPATVSAAAGPPPSMPVAGQMSTAGMSSSGMGAMGSVPALGPANSTIVSQQMQQHAQGMMMGGGMSGGVVGGKGPRSVTQLDGLEAARQQNLEKIQQLQETLQAAHQQEAQFKSQMDIMSHLHAAQQQEQHYKQLEEQQRKHQLQQQLQQQLRAAGAHPTRILRPMLPTNPGLKHLLQQQPQYRPGTAVVRPTTQQTQQFDDVNNYNDFLQ